MSNDASDRELWTAEQCAAERGIPAYEWERQVFSGREPQPAIRDTSTNLWDAQIVRTWRQHAHLNEGEWFAQRCAAYHGITRKRWWQLAELGRVPAPKRMIGRNPVWSADEVRNTAALQPGRAGRSVKVRSVTGPPEPDSETWTAKECANYLGISTHVWRNAVHAGKAPAPSGHIGERTRVWDSDAVRALRESEEWK